MNPDTLFCAIDPLRDSTNLPAVMSTGPIRILHLVDFSAGFQTRRGATSLARDLGTGFDVQTRTIGEAGDYSNLFAALTRLRREVAGTYDVIHAWGGRALAAALTLSGPIVHTMSDSPSAKTIGWLRAAMVYSPLQVVCPTATLRRTCVERGIPLDRCHLIRPGVEFAKIRRRRDSALRSALGFGENDRVMLLAGESTRSAGHQSALWAAAILHVLNPKFRVLVWGPGNEIPNLIHFANGQNSPNLLRVAEHQLGRKMEYEELLPASDLILVTPRGPVATLPISIAMAAALPIVATVSYTVGELLEDRHTALLAAPGAPRALARRVLDLEGDPNLQWSLSDMARTEAYEFFAHTRFVNQYRGVYRQLAEGGKVEVPEIAPGAGMRFHGRG